MSNKELRTWTSADLHRIAFEHFMTARVLQVAAELDIFTYLQAKPMSVEALAQRLNVDQRGLAALMTACTAMQLLEKSEQGYSTASGGVPLLSTGGEHTLQPLLAGASGVYRDWVELERAIRTGSAVAASNLAKGSAETRAYVLEMHNASSATAQVVARTVALEDARRLLDIGCGAGTFAAAFCRRNPQLRATLLDRTNVITVTAELLSRSDLAPRMQTVEADFLDDPLPPGHDVALLCNVLHLLDAELVRQLLRKVHTALRQKATIVLLDAVLDDDKCGPLSVALGALNQLIHHQSATYYSEQELTTWLQEAGFAKVQRKSIPFPHQALLVAVKS